MLGKAQPKEKENVTFFGVKDGKFLQTTGEAKGETFSFMDGTLLSIVLGEREFKGTSVPYWFMNMKDGSDRYVVSFPYGSGVLKAIVLSLASDETLSSKSPIRIELYDKDGLTKTNVYSEGVKLEWVSEALPPVEAVPVGSKIVKDDSKRMAFINSLAKEITKRVKSHSAALMFR